MPNFLGSIHVHTNVPNSEDPVPDPSLMKSNSELQFNFHPSMVTSVMSLKN